MGWLNKYQNGGVVPKEDKLISLPEGTNRKIAYANAKGLDGKQLSGFEDQDISDETWRNNRDKFFGEFRQNWINKDKNDKLSQFSPEYMSMISNMKDSWFKQNQRGINNVVKDYRENGPANPSLKLGEEQALAINPLQKQRSMYGTTDANYENGGVIEDDRGQWAHPGKVTKINSNDITMKGVDYPVLGISDSGDQQMMYPGEDYKFNGKSVTEFPMAQHGKIINVSSKNDPRYIAYQDSLALYNNNKNKKYSRDYDGVASMDKDKQPHKILKNTENNQGDNVKVFDNTNYSVPSGTSNDPGKGQYISPESYDFYDSYHKRNYVPGTGKNFNYPWEDDLIYRDSVGRFKQPNEKVIVEGNDTPTTTNNYNKKITPIRKNPKVSSVNEMKNFDAGFDNQNPSARVPPQVLPDSYNVIEEIVQNFGGSKRTFKTKDHAEIERLKRKNASDKKSKTGNKNKLDIKPQFKMSKNGSTNKNKSTNFTTPNWLDKYTAS